MGFTEIALFGTDCGMRPGSLRHAKGTVYSEVGIYEAGNRSQSPAMQVEGNFGGVVETEIIYDACRLMLGDAIRHYRLNVLNCSDGALIPGAQPRVPEALEVPATPVDGAAVRAEVERGMPSYPRGKMLDEADFGAVRARTHEMFAALDAILAALGEGKPDFGTVYDRMVAFGYAVIALGGEVEGYLRASEVSRDRVEDIRTRLKEGDSVTAMIINIDRKNRSINLSIKAKDNAEEGEAMQRMSAENQGANTGTTNLGALLKAKLSDTKSNG